jgi:hypothetical protein
MGYRLEISKVVDVNFGSKLYGYVEDKYVDKLKSLQWLVANGHISEEEKHFADWGGNPSIILRKDEFKEYMELYYQDLNEFKNSDKTSLWEFDEDMKKLIEEDCKKLLEWW